MMKKMFFSLGLAAALMSCSDDEAEVEGTVGASPMAGDQVGDSAIPGSDQAGIGSGQAGIGSATPGMPGAPDGNGMMPNTGSMKDTMGANSQGMNPGAGGQAANVGQIEGEGNNNGMKRFVRSYYLFVRSGPGMNFKPVGSLKFNSEIQAKDISKKGHWVKIGDKRWVSSRYLSDQPNTKAWAPKIGH